MSALQSSSEKLHVQLTFFLAVDQCGAILTSPVGLITSPNYPEPYPSNEECNTTIRVAKGPIKLAFQAFDVGNTV